MPFTNAYHGGGREPVDLGARIDLELRGRIEDAVDFACLDAMVRARRARHTAAPAADDPRDREEYEARVEEFLARLESALVQMLDQAQCARLGVAGEPRQASIAARMDMQVKLAKMLPDYWQRFDAIRLSFASERGGSGGEPRRLLDWLLGRR